MKKTLALILALMLVAASLIACSESGSDTSDPESKADPVSQADESAADESEVEESSEATPYEHLKRFNFADTEVLFLVVGDGKDRYKSIEIMPYEDSADAIREAVETRNSMVEDLLSVSIDEIRTDNFLQDARNDIQGGGEYDIICPWMPDAATLASEGSLYDLYEFSDILLLDKPYWDQGANADLSFANKLYFTTGDFSLLTFDCTHAIVFNKTLREQCGAEDPYQLLRDDKWTFDALYRNAKLATADTDGTDGMKYTDTWGLILNENYTTSMFIGSGERITTKDSDDIPMLAIETQRAPTVVEKIRQITNDPESTILIEKQSVAGTGYKDVYYAASAAIGEDRALFRTLAIVDLGELDDFDCSYGVLPTPKFNEEQENYYNVVSAIMATSFCIPMSAEDPEMSAAVGEAMSLFSTDTVRKAYYNTILKGRRIADEEGEFALDIIFNNRVYEMATIYQFGSIYTVISDCAKASSDIFASKVESVKGSVEAAIEDLAEKYMD